MAANDKVEKLKRHDFLNCNKDDKEKTIAKKSNTKTTTTKTKKTGTKNEEDTNDKMDRMIDIIQQKDDKVCNAITEMTNIMKSLLNREENIKKMNKETKEEKKERRKEEAYEIEEILKINNTEEPMNEENDEHENDNDKEDDFFKDDDKTKNPKHVEQVMFAQNNILSMSNDYTRQLKKINRAEKADPNIPTNEKDTNEDYRNNEASIVRKIAYKVAQMQKEVNELKIKVKILNEEKEKKSTEQNQLLGRNQPSDQPSRTSDLAEKQKKTQNIKIKKLQIQMKNPSRL